MNGNTNPAEHPQLQGLPEWPTQTVGLLATVDSGPL